jgi:hypothetical protein
MKTAVLVIVAFLVGVGVAALALRRPARLVASPAASLVVTPDATEPPPGERTAGERLLAATGTCLKDVRDRGLSYETSPTCQGLHDVSLAYIQAVGATAADKMFPTGNACVFTRAERTAWSARATSAAGRPVTIW